MKLRTQFILLTVGAVIVPPLMVALAGMIGFLAFASPDGPQGALAVQTAFRLWKSDEVTVQSATAKLFASDRNVPITVVDAEGTVRYPRVRAGTRFVADDIVTGPQTTESRATTVLSVPDEDGGYGLIVTSYEPRGLAEHMASVGIVMPLAFVVFMAIMSVLIIRSINVSITRLEEATRRIASGDLDFKLSSNGGDSLASLTRSFDSMRRQLKEQFDRGSRFLMGISHDLKTPLSSITGYVDAIRDGLADTPEKLDKYTAIVHAKTRLLESRISALIDYAKQETHDWKGSLRLEPLARYLEEFAGLADAEAGANGFAFATRIAIPDDLLVEMDPDMVGRALENLLQNAFSYATPGSTVTFTAERTMAGHPTDAEVLQEGAIRISIENTGPGIPPGSLEHIFDPFYRAEGARSGSGFGLGLAIVKSVIVSHGWEIRAQSEPGARTVFTVTIPENPDAPDGEPPGLP